MNTEVHSAKAEFLKEALYTHAGQIRDYFTATRSRIDSYEGALRQQHLLDFVSRAGLIVNQLDTLVRSARRVKMLAANMNLEQLEALVQRLYQEVQLLSREALGGEGMQDLREAMEATEFPALPAENETTDPSHEAA